MGLDGIEAYYPQHSRAEAEWFCQAADRLGLLITAGEDFHGPYSEKFIQIGTLAIPPELSVSIRSLMEKHAG